MTDFVPHCFSMCVLHGFILTSICVCVVLQENLSTDLNANPTAHSFSSSSVMTYSKVGDEPPKVFQASSQTRRAPGGVRTLKYGQR